LVINVKLKDTVGISSPFKGWVGCHVPLSVFGVAENVKLYITYLIIWCITIDLVTAANDQSRGYKETATVLFITLYRKLSRKNVIKKLSLWMFFHSKKWRC